MAIGRPISLTPNVKSKRISVTATADQTLFTVTGGYRINNLSVYRNGARLVQGSDFTASDGSTVTLLSAATVNDVVAFEIFGLVWRRSESFRMPRMVQRGPKYTNFPLRGHRRMNHHSYKCPQLRYKINRTRTPNKMFL